MAATTGKELKDAVLAQFASEGTSAAESLAKAAFVGYKECLSRGLDAAAGNHVNLCADYSTGVGIRVTGVAFVPSAALTANNTNYVSLKLVYNNGNGGSDTIVAMANSSNTGATLGTGDWVSDVAEALTITAANAVIPSGSQVQVKFEKVASGVVVPPGTVVIKGEWE
jgi:hypothetical protein